MAGNYITIGSKFKPFSYEELVKPYEKYGNAYREQENLFSDIQAQSNEIADQINAQREAESFNIYKGYNDKLTEQAAQLSKEGLNIGSRKNLIDMRNRYSKEILPIKKLIETRSKIADEQRQLYVKDKSIMYDKDFSTISLDELRKNPNMSYKALSGSELAVKSAALASTLKDQILTSPEYKSILGGQYFQSKLKSGMTLNQILAASLNDDNAPAELKQIKNNLIKEYNIDQYSLDIQDRANSAINSGFYNALGTTKYDLMKDESYMSPLQRAQLALSQRAQRLQEKRYEDEKAANETMFPTEDGGYIQIGAYGKMYKFDKNKKFVGQVDNNNQGSIKPTNVSSGFYSIDSDFNATPKFLDEKRADEKIHFDNLAKKKNNTGISKIREMKVSFGNLPKKIQEAQLKQIQDDLGKTDISYMEIDAVYDMYYDQKNLKFARVPKGTYTESATISPNTGL